MRRPHTFAIVLVGSMVVSQAIPWAEEAFAGNVPPLLSQFHPSIGPWLPLAIIAILAAIAILPGAMRWPTWQFLTVAILLGWVVAVTLAAESHGLSAITAPFRRPLEYWASVPLARSLGVRAFVSQFPDFGGRLSLHAATHGPSAVLFLWLLSGLSGGNLLGVSLWVTLVGVVGAIPAYAIAQELAGERTARLAALLFLCAPGVLIYSATSMDAVFMTVVAVALAALVRAPRSPTWAIGAGALWALALSFTFGAFTLGLFAVGIGVIALRDRRRSAAALIARGAMVVVGMLLGLLLLRLVLGMNLVADFRAASRANFHDASRARPYLYWVFANIPAFLWVAGIAQTALLVHQTRMQWRARSFGFETVLLCVIALSSLSGVFLGEVDHIWLFFIPPLAAVAASGLERTLDTDEHRADSYVRGVLAGSLGQATLIQVLLYTYW
jgi:4-amino-4-deoxy-L-arabinose transferase-like glycosyltransferase